jgi:hypothetical protein
MRKGGAISFLAQIVMVADEYDHLTNTTDPRKRLCPTEALSHLYLKRRQTLPEHVIVWLIHVMSLYPPGTFVLLSDDSLGIVVSTSFASMTRPTVMICETNSSVENPVIVNLTEDKDLAIRRVLGPAEVPPEVLNYWNPRRLAGYFVHIKDATADTAKHH